MRLFLAVLATAWVLLLAFPAAAQMGFLLGYTLGSSGGGGSVVSAPSGIPGECLAATNEGDYRGCRVGTLRKELKESMCNWSARDREEMFQAWPDMRLWCDYNWRIRYEWNVIETARNTGQRK